MAKAVRAAIGDKWIRCGFCDDDVFRAREVKLNSTGMELLDLGWANESATALICWTCGQVQMFANRALQLYKA
jgi:hypothetical protein